MSLPEDAILAPAETESIDAPPTDLSLAPLDDVHDAQYIRIDLVPANGQFTAAEGATVASHFLPNSRIIVTDTYAYVFTEGAPEPVRALKGYLTGFTGSNKEGYTAHFQDGELYFRRSESCACGSRLRGIRPFPYVPQVPLSIF